VAREGGAMDFDAVVDELYGLPPAEFTAVRKERAQAARKAGDRSLAERIAALRKPTLAAWASNVLVRERRDEVQPLLGMGEALRRAHRELDGDQLRELGRRQRALVRALSEQARELAARAGQRLGDGAVQEVEETLHAALADPEAGRSWAAGHLTKPLSATVGITGLTAVAAVPAAPPSERQAEDAAAERRRRELDEARSRAREAGEEAEAREVDEAAAQQRAEAAGRRHDEARARLAELTEQVEAARRAERTAGDAREEARRLVREAARTAREARRRADDAAAHAERLAGGTRGGGTVRE
jgi:hypothetical protein